MGKIYAVVNQKGGVGKTTTAVNLTAALHKLGKRVLLCDFDPQANATSGMGLDKKKLRYSVYDAVINEIPAEQVIQTTKYGDVLPSSADLAGAAVELLSMEQPSGCLKAVLEPLKNKYDLIFIDCPPSLEMLNGLMEKLSQDSAQQMASISKKEAALRAGGVPYIAAVNNGRAGALDQAVLAVLLGIEAPDGAFAAPIAHIFAVQSGGIRHTQTVSDHSLCHQRLVCDGHAVQTPFRNCQQALAQQICLGLGEMLLSFQQI